MELIGTYYDDCDNREDIYINKGKVKYFYYITDKSCSKVYEWFISKENILDYCQKNFNKFEQK